MITCLGLLSTACGRNASAQNELDPLSPVQCFQIVDAKNLSNQSALELCAGAISDAPGRCYAEAIDQLHSLSSQQIMQLCQSATSMDPIACYARLDAIGTLTGDQMIGYCTTACPVGPPPPESSSPACLGTAVERTQLALQTAGELCLGSRSAGPVDCYLAGRELQTLADSQLVQLCAETTRCQY